MRKPRADSLRNRERLLEAAKAGFTEVGPEVTLEEIARRAEVGIGTLYRHFPTRNAIVEAVYSHEVAQMAEAAGRLATSDNPAAALREWMLLFVDYIATKKVVVAALNAMPTLPAGVSGPSITEAFAALVQRAKTAGQIRPDAEPADLLRALVGFTYGTSGPDWEASARRLIEIVMDGLVTRAAQ